MGFSPPIVLTFAASDPTGGAGLQADVLTLASMGCHPLSVLTGVTVQDTTGVHDVFAVDGDWVRDQARRVLEDMPVSAFKLGVLGSVENIKVISDILFDYPQVPVVLDPVLASGRGDLLASEEMADALRELLIPQATILTPNSIEARRLAASPHERGAGERDGRALADCAAGLLALGCAYVLITGTHEAGGEVVNTLYASGGMVCEDRWQRLPATYHGSGCTLASAIAAALANGLQIPEAVRDAQEYTWQALSAGFRPGMGQWLPDRFFWAREAQGQR